MLFYAILFKGNFGFAQGQQHRAERHEMRGAQLVLLDGEQVVYQAPARYIHEVIACATQKQATDHVREYMEACRTSGFHGVSEGSAARRRKGSGDPVGGALAEGINIRITER